MKSILKLIPIVLLMLILQNCSEEESVRKEKVHFTFKPLANSMANGKLNALPEGTQLRISIQTAAGNPVLTNYSIALLRLGDSYITEPIDLAPGNYKIIDFMLVKDSEVLYATPHKGAPLAGAVVNPLEVMFSVSDNVVTNIEMEVLDASQHAPEDFGFVALTIGIANTFEVGVFTAESNRIDFTNAFGCVLRGLDTIRAFNITPMINRIAFTGDPDEIYTLHVVKDGSDRYARQFKMADLLAELDGKPLNVLLNPAFTMLFHSKGKGIDNRLLVNINGTVGKSVTINWGDGATSSHIFADGDIGGQSHTYAKEGDHFISVTGDLAAVTHFSSVSNRDGIERISVEHLPELKSLVIGYNRSPEILDLSRNGKLKLISLANLDELKTIVFPSDHSIDDVYLSGSINVTTATIDHIIESLYSNAVGKSITEGRLTFETQYNSGVMIGSPSAASLSRLRQLRDIYGWQISPNPN